MASPEPAGLEFVDRLDMEGHFGFGNSVELNPITKVLLIHKDLELWFSPKTIDYNCDRRLVSC